MYIRIKEQGLEHVDPKVGGCLLPLHKKYQMISGDILPSAEQICICQQRAADAALNLFLRHLQC